MKKWAAPLIGLVTGFVNGMFGSAGGTVLVPAMEKFMGMETHKAHATAIAIILPLSVFSAILYLWGVPVDWSVVLYVSAGGCVGGFTGAALLNRVPTVKLHRLFGLFMIVAAFKMIF